MVVSDKECKGFEKYQKFYNKATPFCYWNFWTQQIFLHVEVSTRVTPLTKFWTYIIELLKVKPTPPRSRRIKKKRLSEDKEQILILGNTKKFEIIVKQIGIFRLGEVNLQYEDEITLIVLF